MDVSDHILRNINKGNVTGAVVLDLSKANWFSANHELIINCTKSKVIFFQFEAEAGYPP